MEEVPIKRKDLFLPIILIAVLGFCVYINSLNGWFLWDDDVLVKDNIYIKSWANILKILTKDIGAGGMKEYHAYRPVQMLTYMVDYSFWKLNVVGYHLANILLHVLVALLIYWLITILFKNSLLSLLTSLLFVAHPIHTEVVTYISGRADSLAALFMLLCLIYYIKNQQDSRLSVHLIIWLSYLLAILSKEYALILPLLLILYHFTFKVKLKVKNFLPFLYIIFSYILLHIMLFGSLVSYKEKVSTNLWQRMPGFFVAFGEYLRLLFLPFRLHMEYGNQLFMPVEPKVISGILIFILLLTLALFKRRHNQLISFSILWFFLSLSPQSNIFPVNAYMAEHWLYLPSLGFFLILANSLSVLYKNKKLKVAAIILIASLLAFYSFLTVKQNNYWRRPIIFYERLLEYTNSYKIFTNLGNIFRDNGEPQKAVVYYKRVIELKPNKEDGYNNLALAYHDIGNYSEAIALYEKVIEINPRYAKAYNNLGNTYKEIGKSGKAVEMYRKATEIFPEYADAHNNLGIVLYTSLGKKDEGMRAFKKAVEINPEFADAHNNLSVAYYYQTKQYDLAIKHCDRAVKLGYNVRPEYLKLLEPFRK